MKWRQFLTPVKSLDVEKARQYVSEHPQGGVTLLDVRQPKEYEQERIPGATLVPLPELLNRLEEIDPTKPVIVYCAIGGRSRVGAQMLVGQGFREVYNLKGGIKAWQGAKAVGPAETGLGLIDPRATPDEVLALAYGLEEGLASIYRVFAARTADSEMKSTFEALAEFEETHKQRVLAIYGDQHPAVADAGAFEQAVLRGAMEGGFSTEEFLVENRTVFGNDPEIIDMAMMIEAQALDLYHRYAQKSGNEASAQCFRALADEEKAHLAQLGELLEKRV